MANLGRYTQSTNASLPHHNSPVAGRKGYAKVAEFIASDKELAIYHRFDRTAARVLLVLQSEILLKQQQLDEIDSDDATDHDEKRRLAAATIYDELPLPPDLRDEKKNILCKELRLLLKEYCMFKKKLHDTSVKKLKGIH